MKVIARIVSITPSWTPLLDADPKPHMNGLKLELAVTSNASEEWPWIATAFREGLTVTIEGNDLA